MEFKKPHIIGLSVGLVIIIVGIFLSGNVKLFLIGIGIFAGIIPFALSFIYEVTMTTEKEEMFLEFARNLVESVKTGTPISKSIVNLKEKQYGVLSQHINKLADQIIIGIPLSSALKTFAKDADNKTISRALTLIGQAEKAGGDIGQILESVAGSVSMTDKLKKERKASVSTLVVQGYIIFIVFILIILVMQFKIIPMVAGLSGGLEEAGLLGGGGGEIDAKEIANSFLYLLLIQGFFSGLTIGKLAEGNIKNGIKHSLALMLISFFISATANLFLG